MSLRPKQTAFLKALVATAGNIVRASKAAGIAGQTHYDWLREDNAEYNEAFEEAKAQAAEVLEAEAIRRAHDGVERPVVSMGRIVMVQCVDLKGRPLFKNVKNEKGKMEKKPVMRPLMEITYSDALMQTLLKGHLPEKFRERSEQQNTGSINLTITSEDAEL